MKILSVKIIPACLLGFCLMFTPAEGINAQGVGVGTAVPHPSAALDVVSNSKGLSIPSLTTLQRNGIATPKAGLFVFDTDRQTLCMFNGSNWVYFQSSVEANLVQPVEFTAADGDVGDQFGYSVAISGNYAVIGSPFDIVGNNNGQGSVNIFFFNGANWVEQAKLVAANGAAADNFGYSVGISGDYVIVGAPNDDVGANSNQGSAYIFTRSGTTWTQQANFSGSAALAGDFFGKSVSMDGAYAAIGAPGDDVGVNAGQGTAYVFIRTGVNWSQQDYVTIPSGAAGDAFGTSVSISGIQLFVGAPYDDITAVVDAGSVHVFQRSGTAWSHVQLLTYLQQPGELCGFSVSVNGNYAVIGAPNKSTSTSSGSGRAYIFNGTSWVTTEYGNFLTSIPGINGTLHDGDTFCYSVSVGGDYIIAGAPFSDTLGSLRGISYLFKTNGADWFFVRPIIDPLGGLVHLLGYSVGISGTWAIMGAPFANGQKGKVLMLKL